jgi:hypothetical protein
MLWRVRDHTGRVSSPAERTKSPRRPGRLPPSTLDYGPVINSLRLSRFFGTSERFWINLQARYDLEAEKDRLGSALDGIRPLSAAS